MWHLERDPVSGRAGAGLARLVRTALLFEAAERELRGGAGAAARQALPEGAADGSGSKRKWYEDQKKKRADELKRLGLQPEQARAADLNPNPDQPHQSALRPGSSGQNFPQSMCQLVRACRWGCMDMRAAGPRLRAWDRGDAGQAQ